MNEALEELLAITDAMRSRGVRSFDVVGKLRVDFIPPEPPPMKSDAKTVDAENCRCGHGLHAHNAGLCLLGCEPDKCLEPEA